MFTLKKPATKTGLEEAIDAVLAQMSQMQPDEDDYAKMVKQLTKLHKLKENEKPSAVSKDTLLIVGGNLVGIVLIIGHERANVITTKALSFVRQLR